MRLAISVALVAPLVLGSSAQPRPMAAPEQIRANDNRTSAGVLRNGILTVHLEVREGVWHPDRDTDPGIVVRAFAEEGRQASAPGPMIRVPEGTEIHASVRNTLARGTLVVRGLSAPGVAGASDTIVLAPGERREVAFSAGAPGTYFYRAAVSGAPAPDSSTIDAPLHGALVIDPRGRHAVRSRLRPRAVEQDSRPPVAWSTRTRCCASPSTAKRGRIRSVSPTPAATRSDSA